MLHLDATTPPGLVAGGVALTDRNVSPVPGLTVILDHRPRNQTQGAPMSIRVMTAVFDHSEARGTDRLILLIIADRSNDDGTGCWRGKESIAHMARVSRTTVTESIRRLEASGELQVERRPGTTSQYRIVLAGVGQNPADQVGQNPADGRPDGLPTVGHTGGRDTSFNRPLSTAPNATALERGLLNDPVWDFDEKGNLIWKGPNPDPRPTSPNR